MAANLPALSFHDTRFDLVEHTTGEPWLTGLQIASALGYSNPGAGMSTLYERNAAEFTDRMTCTLTTRVQGDQARRVRIFSLRGAHLLGMFARTERAAEFRRWVLDVLEHQAAPAAAAPQLVAPALASVTAQRDRLRAAVIAQDPQHRLIVRYHAIAGLNHDEKARLMGWQDGSSWRNALKRLAALGLIDYAPNPRLSHGRNLAEVSHG